MPICLWPMLIDGAQFHRLPGVNVEKESGQAHLPPLKLRSVSLLPACAALRAAADLHSASSVEGLFPTRQGAPVTDPRALRDPAPPVPESTGISLVQPQC